MPDADPLTLPLFCPTCGQPVYLVYTPAETEREVHWSCPYRTCQRLHRIGLKGTVVEAVARYEPPA